MLTARFKNWSEDQRSEILEYLLLEKSKDATHEIPIEGPRTGGVIGWFLPLRLKAGEIESQAEFARRHGAPVRVIGNLDE
jgi:hypothetical protein